MKRGLLVTLVALTATAALPAPEATVMWFSDFRTATGRTDAALRDGGKWDIIAGNGRLNEVVSSNGLNFPMPNVLKVTAGWRSSPPGAAAENPRLEVARQHLRVPAVGGSTFYRWYIRVIEPDNYTVDLLTHPIQDGISGETSNWQFEVRNGTNGTWTMSWNVSGAGQNPWPNNRWSPPAALQKNHTYRVELRINRTGTSTFTMAARLYDQASRLVAGNEQFRNANGSATLGSGTTLRLLNVATLGGFQAGFNGLNGGSQSNYPVPLYYQGGFAVARGGWAGAWGSLAGEQ